MRLWETHEIIIWNLGHRACGTYLVSSRYHSKSGAGTAEASHLREACRPVVASLLLDSVIVGGSVVRAEREVSYARGKGCSRDKWKQ